MPPCACIFCKDCSYENKGYSLRVEYRANLLRRMQNLVIGMSWLDEYGISVAFPALRQVAVLACPESSSRVFVLGCCWQNVSNF